MKNKNLDEITKWCLQGIRTEKMEAQITELFNYNRLMRVGGLALGKIRRSGSSVPNIQLLTLDQTLKTVLQDSFRTGHIVTTQKGLVLGLLGRGSLVAPHLWAIGKKRNPLLNARPVEEVLKDSQSLERFAMLAIRTLSDWLDFVCELQSYPLFLMTNRYRLIDRIFAAAMSLNDGFVVSYEHGLTDPTEWFNDTHPVVDFYLTRSEYERRVIELLINTHCRIAGSAIAVGGLSPIKWNACKKEKKQLSDTKRRSVLFIGSRIDLSERDLVKRVELICDDAGFKFGYRPHPKMDIKIAKRLGVPLQNSTRTGRYSLVKVASSWGTFIGEYSTSLVEAKYFGVQSIQLIDREKRRLAFPEDVDFVCSTDDLTGLLGSTVFAETEPRSYSSECVVDSVLSAITSILATPRRW